MTLTATKFTPEVMLSAPRRSPAVPNRDGTHAIFTVSAYSFETHKKTSQIRLLSIPSGQSSLLVEDSSASEPVWLGNDEFLFLKSGENGTTTIVLGHELLNGKHAPKLYDVATVKAPVSNLKAKQLPSGSVALVVSALTTPDGQLYNPETETKPLSSAKVYTSIFARHWDTWSTENVNSLWYGALGRDQTKGGSGKWGLQGKGLVNALAGTGLSSPVPPFGGTADFDISPEGLVFVAKDPELNEAIYTKTNLYYVALKNFTEDKPPAPQRIETPGLEGYSQAPVFSNDGRRVAFTRMRDKQYESDKTRILLLPDVNDLSKNPQEFYATEDGEGGWDARPDTILWSADDSELFVTVEQAARVLIVKLPSDPSKAKDLPTPLTTTDGSVSDIRLLSNNAKSTTDALFVSSTSLIDNSCYSIVNPKQNETNVISSTSRQGKTFGLSRSSIGSIAFQGAGDYDVHALVIKPSTFDSSKKYPLAFFIHGGPQGAWGDSWSTRWNPAIFAEQGYVVVAVNPTGSTGYGMALQNGIKGDWGGKPYEDLVKAFDYIEENLEYVDTERAVALGASYGGYMINWIQGHPLGRKFKALVCHDGVFSTLNQWSTEELFFPIHDFNGTFYENREAYEKWDPARFVSEWATPELIIHSELDYRLPVTEGLAAFNVLQAKKVPSKLLVYPDENHWVLKVENSLVWHKEVLGWVNKYSGIEEEQQKRELAERAEGLEI